jgi:LmbE family N-acetylglucosaminyl deacetylase
VISAQRTSIHVMSTPQPAAPSRRIPGRSLFASVTALTLTVAAPLLAADDADPPGLAVSSGERLLVLAPHPDDETLGAAGLAQRVLASGGRVQTLILTAGDGFVEGVQQHTGQTRPTPEAFLDYGVQRIQEAQRVAKVLSEEGKLRVSVMGFPDGGLLPLLFSHWDTARPARSDTTLRRTVPYRETSERFLAYSGGNVRAAIVNVMRDFRPTMIAFPDVLDEHPDHRAVGLFALLSATDYMRARGGDWPELLAYMVHWSAWPPGSDEKPAIQPRGDTPLALPADLPTRGQERSCLTLTDEEVARKHAALQEYRTQLDVMPEFLNAFVRRTECFSLNRPETAVSLTVGIRRQVRDLAAKLARDERR